MPEGNPDCLRPTAFPAGIGAASSTRAGGVSTGRYTSLNLGMHVGDDAACVAENRKRLGQFLSLPAEPRWLEQVHGTRVIGCPSEAPAVPPRADAAVSRESGVVLAVMTADCLPVLLAARDGTVVGVAHAGWRGLAAGVIEATLAAMRVEPTEAIAWLGPAIGPAHYEVGSEVREAFTGSPGADAGFVPAARAGHWHCNLGALARARLVAAGVGSISGGDRDTFAEPGRFFSWRRDGETGRMASLIWLASPT